MKRRIASLALAAVLILPTLSVLTGCGSETTVLRVYNWEEYIDEGGEDSYYDENANPLVDDFEIWYEETYGSPIRVEYSTFGTNEDLYNQLKLGDSYDLVCPSEYMIMKLGAENMLEPYPESFFDESNEHNYYINNVSPFIRGVFENGKMTADGAQHTWSEYAAGYMWGTTGLVYNPETVDENDLSQGWSVMLDEKYKGKVTTKDNVRDSYFVGLAIYYRDELLALDKTAEDYNKTLTAIMNRTDEQSVSGVQNVLTDMKNNIFGFETDTGKSDMVTGKISMNFAWSGDGVYAIDQAEEKDVLLSYFVPDECANLFFDGWVMPKGANTEAAMAFVNFLSRPDNAVRNMNYIGYTSSIAADEVLEFINDCYGVAEEDEAEAVPYDISYFFGKETVILTYEDQLKRQLYAQYPTEEIMRRCAVMDYYGDAEASINELWTKIKGETLDVWAICILAVAAGLIVLWIVFRKFGNRIEFRKKPKKGYTLVKQERIL